MVLSPRVDSPPAPLASPAELLAYERWLQHGGAAANPSGDYLFSEARRRFHPADGDVLVATDDLELMSRGGVVHLTSARLGAALAVPGVTPTAAAAVLAAIDGQRPLAVLRDALGAAAGALPPLLAVGFGVVIFAPTAVAALDACVPGIELVRYPGSPYEIDRAYWANLGDVESELAAAEPTLGDPVLAAREPQRALAVLQRAHVAALMGRSRASYYRPASPIARRGAQPGALLTTEPELVEAPGETRFVSGPRVRAALVGGALYHRALYLVLSDPDAERPRSQVEGGLDWGRVVLARADQDAASAPWFCPPRPLQRAHLTALFGALAAAHGAVAAGDSPGVLRELASFHQRFVRLHPFRCANQSLAMALVNRVLRRSHGAGIPHLILDHLALRLRPEPYRRLFAGAVEQWSVEAAGSGARFGELSLRKRRAFACVERIAAAGTLAEALAIVAADLDAARLALFAA